MKEVDLGLSGRGSLAAPAAGFLVQGSGAIRVGIIGCDERDERRRRYPR